MPKLSISARRIGQLLLQKWGGSQSQMSRDTGVTQATISRIVAGKRHPGHLTIVRIAECAHVDAGWLLGTTKEPSPASAICFRTGTYVVPVAASDLGLLDPQSAVARGQLVFEPNVGKVGDPIGRICQFECSDGVRIGRISAWDCEARSATVLCARLHDVPHSQSRAFTRSRNITITGIVGADAETPFLDRSRVNIGWEKITGICVGMFIEDL
jgi:transcriptional regulator with XRE-family HTH domain